MTDLPCACANARQVARVLTQLYDRRLRGAGLEAPQFALLIALEKLAPCSQVDLGRRHALDKTTVSRNLKVMERNGWIQSSVGSDRRAREFTLTSDGCKILAAAKPEWKRAQNDLQSVLTPGEWKAMFRIFRTVTQAVQKL